MSSKVEIIREVVESVESLLGWAYGFDVVNSVGEFLITKTELSQYVRAPKASGVYVSTDDEHDEAFMGVYLTDEVKETVTKHNPLKKLSMQNIQAFCVVVEEVSHFHLLANRVRLKQPVTQIELEWHAEIDKAFISSHFLKLQNGRDQSFPLMRILFDADITYASTQENLYETADRYAARFLYQRLNRLGRLGDLEEAAPLLRSLYWRQWQDKYSYGLFSAA